MGEFWKQGFQGFWPNLGLKCPSSRPTRVFWAYSQLSPLFTHIPWSLCVILVKSLLWILRTHYTRFLGQFVTKCPIWGQRILKHSQLSPLFTCNALSLWKICKKKSLEWIPITICMIFLSPSWDKNVPFGGQKEFFQNIHYCYLCLRVLSLRKISKNWVDYVNKVDYVLGPIWDTNVLFGGQKEYFQNVHYFHSGFTFGALSLCKIWKQFIQT